MSSPGFRAEQLCESVALSVDEWVLIYAPHGRAQPGRERGPIQAGGRGGSPFGYLVYGGAGLAVGVVPAAARAVTGAGQRPGWAAYTSSSHSRP